MTLEIDTAPLVAFGKFNFGLVTVVPPDVIVSIGGGG
jgi:hypothetical protein